MSTGVEDNDNDIDDDGRGTNMTYESAPREATDDSQRGHEYGASPWSGDQLGRISSDERLQRLTGMPIRYQHYLQLRI